MVGKEVVAEEGRVDLEDLVDGFRSVDEESELIRRWQVVAGDRRHRRRRRTDHGSK